MTKRQYSTTNQPPTDAPLVIVQQTTEYGTRQYRAECLSCGWIGKLHNKQTDAADEVLTHNHNS